MPFKPLKGINRFVRSLQMSVVSVLEKKKLYKKQAKIAQKSRRKSTKVVLCF